MSFDAGRLVAALTLAHFAAAIDRFLLSVLLTPVKNDFALSDTELGLLQGPAFALLFAGAMVPLGILVDRTNRIRLVVAGLVIWSFGQLSCALSGSFGMLFAARLAIGLGQAALLPAALSLIVERVGPARTGSAIAVFTAGSAIGRGAALIGGGALLGWFTLGTLSAGAIEPWRATLLVSLAPNILAFAMLLTFWESTPKPERRAAHAPGAAPLRHALRRLNAHRAAYGSLFAGAAATSVLIQSVAAWGPTHLHRAFALDPARAGLVFGCVTVVAGPLGNLCGGWLLDRGERRRSAAFSNTLIAVSLLSSLPFAAAFCLSESYRLSVAGLAGFIACASLSTPAGLAAFQRLTPAAMRGRITAILVSGITLCGLGLGPLVVGMLTDAASPGAGTLGISILVTAATAASCGAAAAYAGRSACRRLAGSTQAAVEVDLGGLVTEPRSARRQPADQPLSP